VDVRVVAATNTDLDDQVAHGEFRKDLLYRLKVAVIEVPPLRQRRDDVPVLARTFVSQLCDENGLAPKELAPEAIRLLTENAWPGNVRELKNLLESLVVTVPDAVLGPAHVRGALGAALAPPDPPAAPGLTLREVERLHVTTTLQAHGGNRTRAARALGIGLRTLQRKIKEHGIDVPWQGVP
jgi:DNA-binding NtrC family response regulator